MPTDAESLKWVEVSDFSPGIYDPRGTILNAAGPSQFGQQQGAPLGAAQLFHAILGSSPADYVSVVLADTPLVYWRLGETVGTTAVDSSGNGNDGTYNAGYTLNQASLLVGDSNPSAAFNTTIDTRVRTAPFIGPTTLTAFAFEFLIDLPAVGGDPDSILLIADAAGIAPDAVQVGQQSGFISFNFTGVSGFQFAGYSTPMSIGIHHVVCEWDGANMNIYVDGVKKATPTTETGALLTTVDSFAIISPEVGASLSNALTLDEVAFYTHALGQARVTAHYEASIGTGSGGATFPLPGTYRCVSAPGKGLIGAPRKLTNARVIQEYPIVSAKELANLSIANSANVMVDTSGDGHHGHYDLTNLTRVLGSFGDDAGISATTPPSSPITAFDTPVDILTFNSDWTVNVWMKVGVNLTTSYRFIEVESASTGSIVGLTYKNAGTFVVVLTRNPNGAGSVAYTPLTTAALSNAYHMVSVTYTEATDTVRLYVDGVLADTQVGAGTVPAIFGTDAVINGALVGDAGYCFDNFSLHHSVWSGANLLALFGANADFPTYRTELFSHAAALNPDSFYPFNEGGTHAVTEQRALVTASHLVSPILTGAAAIQPTPPSAPAYQDGLFVSFSWFVDPTATSILDMWNQTDARLYKLWLDPVQIYDFRSGFTSAPEPFLVPTRLDTTPWRAPFWHGIGDFAEVVNSVTANGVTPYIRQVVWLYNMVQSQVLPDPWAMAIVAYPDEANHTVDSISLKGSFALGSVVNTPELIFSHEGRLCLVDGFDGDAFGTDAAGRGMNDVVYWAIRGIAFSAFQVFSLQRPIEENQSGIRIAQSVNANELFLVKAKGGGAVISGDLDFPTIRRLPGLHSPGDIYAKPANTPLGVVYAGRGGVYLWSGAESSQLLSPQFDGPFWSPYVGAWSQYTPPANRFGFHGGFDFLHPWVLCPSHFLFDTRFQSWWLLDIPDTGADLRNAPYPSFFMHGTSNGDILSVMPEVNVNNSILAERYDPDLMASGFTWTSQPITPEYFRVAVIREVNVHVTNPNTDPGAGGTLTISLAGLNGEQEQREFQIPPDALPHTYRLTMALETETFVISFDSFVGDGFSAPMIHSFRIGYELTAEHPETNSLI